MNRRATNWGWFLRATLAVCAIFAASFFAPLFAQNSSGHIAAVVDDDGRRFFVNSDPPSKVNLTSTKPRPNIYLPAESSFTGHSRPAVVRAVIETESNWNPKAWSHKGAGGLMQLIPTTAQRYGASDVFNPQQNIDAGVKHLKWLLERYNGNLDLALAAYNAGEGAVDRAHGVPA